MERRNVLLASCLFSIPALVGMIMSSYQKRRTCHVHIRTRKRRHTHVHLSGVVKTRKGICSFLHPCHRPIMKLSCRNRMQKVVSQNPRMRTIMAQGPIQFLSPNLPDLKNIDSIIQLLTSKLCILLLTRRLPNRRRIFVLFFRYLYGSRLIYECKRGEGLINR